jgi:flagellar basal body-associated protein FliL
MSRLIPIAILSTLSLFSLVIGLSFFMMKAPQKKIENYQRVASYYLQQAQDNNLTESSALYLFDEANRLLSNAVMLNPYNEHLYSEYQSAIDQKRLYKKETNTAFLPHKELIQ